MTAASTERVAAVAFCTDQLMEAPLHVAASSLLRNIRADCSVRYYMVLTGYSSKAIERLRRTLDRTGHSYELTVLDAPDSSRFRGLPPLHGSLATYYRLILPEVVQEPLLLYLDSDMQVRTDVSPLFSLEMGTRATGFVVDSTVEYALESQFFFSLGAAPGDPAFNAGTMLFNLPEWRRQNCSERVFEFCREYGNRLINRDQTALNALFAKDCFHLDPQFNAKVVPPVDKRLVPRTGIIHYVGSPKPWDIGGKLLLPYARPWWNELHNSALPAWQRAPWLRLSSWKRFFRILGGYRRVLRQWVQSSRNRRRS
jgi:lipopolysaccharide biosynthesis glycosyltransferase